MSHSVRWTLPKIEQRLKLIEPLVYRRREALQSFRSRLITESDAPLPLGAKVDDSSWEKIEPLSHWGEPYADFVLRSSFTVPADWPSETPCALYLPIGISGDFSHPEGLIYIDGVPYAACDRHHQEVLLKAEWRDGKEHTLALHVWTGLGQGALDVLTQTMLPADATPPPVRNSLLMYPCSVVLLDQATRDFVTSVRIAVGTLRVLDENAPAYGKLLYALDEAFKLLDIRDPLGEHFYASLPAAAEALQTGIAQSGAPLEATVSATGHAHIDIAWLWTVGQARRKAGRTFYTVQRLMEQFPEYHFTQSQPQLYDFVRQDYPELFQAIKESVATGRWEIIGGMWVEADCNLSGPESLARQFLLGRSFFAEHFGEGTESPVLWLPDVFGYAWALPQLIKQAGLKYFFTIKIGWSQYNRLPYDSFWWQGLDGTRVLTHFSTTPEGGAFASTYNANATPKQTLGTWTNFRQKDLGRRGSVPPLLMAYGFGDGGGGPTREMLENIREMGNFPALPKMQQESVGSFFNRLEDSFGDALPTWNGELYLELHRGTYTTQSRNKRANRKSEFLLHDAEFLAAQAALLDPNYRYPHEQFLRAWQLICLNQFHDILPGSSIHAVYEVSQQQYAQIRALALEARSSALESLARSLQSEVLVINPTSFRRADLAFWPGAFPTGQHLVDVESNESIPMQETEQGYWLATGPHAPYSGKTYRVAPGKPSSFTSSLTASPTLLENRALRVELNAEGDIVRIFDKIQQREVMPQGTLANQFQAFEDRPLNWDAWDVDIFYDDKMWSAEPASSITVVEEGPLRATLQIERRILKSSYIQRISLSHDSPRLDITTTIDWRERHILLKVAFPVAILSPTATYEIQWGNVQRPTHSNTSWDWARFETCAQKWVDLSEGNYGVSVLNDGKYGHDIHHNVMRISLLRSPTSPDPEADQGEQIFSYSILPHAGGWNEQTVSAAYALNDPLLVYASTVATTPSQSVSLTSLVTIEQPNIVIETVKQAEDGRGIIVRFYESQRHRGEITLTTGFPLKEVWHTNLLEENEQQINHEGRRVRLNVRPYEIVTLRLVAAGA